jgi:hypothetical protein
MKLFYILCLSLCSIVSLTASTWDGGGASDNWNDPLNWDGDILPGNGSSASVVFNTPGALSVVLDVTSVAVGTFTVVPGTFLTLTNNTVTSRNIAITNGAGAVDFSIASGASLEFSGTGRINLSLSATGAHQIAGILNQNSTAGIISLSNTTVSGIIKASQPSSTPVLNGAVGNTFTSTAVYEVLASGVLLSRTLGPTWDPAALIRISGNFATSPTFQDGSDAVVYGSLEINATGATTDLSASSSVRFGGNVHLINASGALSFGDKVTIHGNLTIAATQTLQVINEAVVKGNVLNAGTINAAGEATLELSGVAPQTIDSDNMTSDLTFKVNNPAGITITGGNIEIPHNLNLAAGIVNTTAANMLVMKDDKTIAGGSNTAHVDGPMMKKGNDDFMFPIGDAGTYAPCGVGVGGSMSDEYVAEYVASGSSDLSNFATQPAGEQLVEVSAVEHWNISAPVFSAGRAITLTYRAASQVNVPADTRIAHYTGGQWKSEGNTAMTAGSIKSGLVASFSPFAFGGVSAAALPVTLQKFAAKAKTDQTVALQWVTANEKAIEYYGVETSPDSKEWRMLDRVASQGDAVTAQNYAYTHQNPVAGLQYYRLAIHEKVGKSWYSPIVSAKLERTQKSLVYPNPVSQELFVETTGSESELADMEVRLFDLSGNQVLAITKPVIGGDRFTLDLSQLPVGSYTVHLVKGAHIESHRIVKTQ